MKVWMITWFLLLLAGTVSSQDTWTHFRGTHLDGHATDGKYPLHFSEDQNVAWKTEIPGLGWSSPVIWGKQVWVTTATKTGNKLSAVCLDFETGRDCERDIALRT